MNYNSNIVYHNLLDAYKGINKYITSQLPVFVNKVLLETSHNIHVYIVYGCFLTSTAELSSGDRDCMAYKPKTLTV